MKPVFFPNVVPAQKITLKLYFLDNIEREGALMYFNNPKILVFQLKQIASRYFQAYKYVLVKAIVEIDNQTIEFKFSCPS